MVKWIVECSRPPSATWSFRNGSQEALPGKGLQPELRRVNQPLGCWNILQEVFSVPAPLQQSGLQRGGSHFVETKEKVKLMWERPWGECGWAVLGSTVLRLTLRNLTSLSFLSIIFFFLKASLIFLFLSLSTKYKLSYFYLLIFNYLDIKYKSTLKKCWNNNGNDFTLPIMCQVLFFNQVIT